MGYHPPLIYGPIAPENNPAIMAQYFKPSQFTISAISYGILTTVTTIENMNYVIGQQVRLTIPEAYGAQELNEQTGLVISIPASNQVVLSINSTNANTFTPNPSLNLTPPQIMAIGDVNTGYISTNGPDIKDALLPGSFENISPATFS